MRKKRHGNKVVPIIGIVFSIALWIAMGVGLIVVSFMIYNFQLPKDTVCTVLIAVLAIAGMGWWISKVIFDHSGKRLEELIQH